MKLSDYVFDFLANLGITHVFGIVGGANSHLADSLVRNRRLRFICTQHEQAAAMAAEGYARAGETVGAVLVTSGPGGTNAITGVSGCWCDSIPVIVISGQVPLSATTDGKTIRQLGVQQINIIDLVKPVTKYAVMIREANAIVYHLERALFLATSGRPGPVWIDIPTEIQRAEIDPLRLSGFNGSAGVLPGLQASDKLLCLSSQIDKAMALMSASARPILIAGNGIRLAKAVEDFRELAEFLGWPVVTTWNGIDLLSHSHPLYLGCAGVMGQRGTNYAIANSDLILSIGSRLDTRQLGNSPDLYARAAKKIAVDINEHELGKGLLKIDLPIRADAKGFIAALLTQCQGKAPGGRLGQQWLKRCREWKKKYPVVLDRYYQEKEVNSFIFIKELCDRLGGDEIIVTDMGTSLTCTMQTFFVKGRQRLFTNTGLAPMGFGLPGSVGAWFGGKSQHPIIGIYGDGGFQMNIQELQTVVHYKIPLKIFILNNRSYLTIKHTQEFFFDGCYSGSEPGSGYSAPDFCRIAEAYGIQAVRLENLDQLDAKVKITLSFPGPALCEVMMPEDQELIPICSLDKSRGYAGSPIERMYPFLPEEEHRGNMLIEPA